MSERSQFWSTTGVGDGAASYTQQNWLEMLRDIFTTDRYATEGVIGGLNSELVVTGTNGASPSVTLAAGGAIVYGFYYQNTSNNTLSVTKPSIGTTGGRVVLRADWTLQTVRAVVKMSADGTSAIPALVQTPGATFEIPLYTFTVTTGGTITLTDVRDFAHPTALVYRRQGGSPTDWTVAGSTVYTPGGVKLQVGVVTIPFSSSADGTAQTVTFGSTFSAPPIVMLTTFSNGSSTGKKVQFSVRSITASQMTIDGRVQDGATTSTSFDCWWLAIGPE